MGNDDRVRNSTSEKVNKKIDEKALSYVRHYVNSSPSEIEDRIKELDEEWTLKGCLN